MSEFELPGIDPAAVPEFADGPGCKAWLENVPLANVSSVKLLPGLPIAAAVPALNAPPTLVTAPGWFKPKRVIEAAIGKPLRARLLEVIERGTDFERLAYEVLPD